MIGLGVAEEIAPLAIQAAVQADGDKLGPLASYAATLTALILLSTTAEFGITRSRQ